MIKTACMKESHEGSIIPRIWDKVTKRFPKRRRAGILKEFTPEEFNPFASSKARLKIAGRRTIVVCPAGFTSDLEKRELFGIIEALQHRETERETERERNDSQENGSKNECEKDQIPTVYAVSLT